MLQPTAKITIAATHVVDSPSFLSNSCRKINSNKYKFDTLFKHLQGFHIKYIWNAHIGKLYGLLSHKAKTLDLPAFFFFFFFIFNCSTSGKGGFEPSLALLKTWPGNSIVTSLLFILLYYIYIYIKVLPCICSKIACQIFPNFKVKNRVDGGREGRRPTSMLVFPLLPSLNHKSLKFPLHLGSVCIRLILLKIENLLLKTL